ncbi:uncharacterized protein PV07_04728 [Cladophialophora immunda]|uniref:Uncharacterized protein n=1 Tax=Cladophialophora immunda TaxID=569365 RepID=A0A0D2CF42_9EURO|nr:uncharacterized protein PV07_04728 [Cladophialophora immunda]KIW28865.1 hypothetical protein PV07_04728 [Cladophialophora immunda]
MPQTLLKYLTAPNARLIVHSPPPHSYTQHDDWDPVENIGIWDDFEYNHLIKRFHTSLTRETDLSSTVTTAEDAGANIICDEAGLTILLGSTNINMVSRALPEPLFIAAGSRITAYPHARPDWGAGDNNLQYSSPEGVCRALVCGDTKLEWDVERAMRLVAAGNYLDQRDANIVRPFEQVQHYCKVYKTRYGFILTNKVFVAVRARLSPSPQGPTSRLSRQRAVKSHNRVLSDTSTGTNVSEISDSFSTMSFRPEPRDADVAMLEVVITPWDHGNSKNTINLHLYCLVRLAAEERALSDHYEPIFGEQQKVAEKRKEPPGDLGQSSTSRKDSTREQGTSERHRRP